MESSAKTRLPLYRYHLPFAITPHHSHFGIIFHSYLLVPMGEKVKGLTKSPFLEIHAKGGESISPKQKDRTTTNFKIFKTYFKISI
jgi:hypothetical protein